MFHELLDGARPRPRASTHISGSSQSTSSTSQPSSLQARAGTGGTPRCGRRFPAAAPRSRRRSDRLAAHAGSYPKVSSGRAEGLGAGRRRPRPEGRAASGRSTPAGRRPCGGPPIRCRGPSRLPASARPRPGRRRARDGRAAPAPSPRGAGRGPRSGAGGAVSERLRPGVGHARHRRDPRRSGRSRGRWRRDRGGSPAVPRFSL